MYEVILAHLMTNVSCGLILINV